MSYSEAIRFADSVDEAVSRLADDPELSILAGSTWVMRAPLRREEIAARYLSLSRIPALREVSVDDDTLSIGAMATHARIARTVAGHADLSGLHQAARKSANPGVRQLATVGGNICARDFAAGDLVPALLALDAEIEVASAGKAETLPLTEFLSRSPDRGALVTRVLVRRKAGAGSHVRLTMRAAGDYPVAIVSAWQSKDGKDTRIALGSVEATARRWTALEAALPADLTGPEAERIARTHLDEIRGRDAVDASGAYRTRVLPVWSGAQFQI
ncbi:hypothetical protein BOO69_18630 (plasmid) [Sulfitobacter alexandrii]|uniref:FAD-binding PCMH-type domain-containing protein n=1 Tax=Sulfitobacter alexandrii TaxID=1917485 RepID=A0A1J0WN35_9RHOB|nr:FAD binding domain-containing protein [Sulfitobacter alexandrii]APE45590.1 hypothetical protein BOO69_18630 [Sulfitobacter alexandrii]